MSIVDICCHDSFCSAWITHPKTQKYYQLFVGQMENLHAFSCLYFHLPPIETLGSIQSIKLYIFNTTLSPFNSNLHNDTYLCPYLLYPLQEYYTFYACQNAPQLDYRYGVYFYGNPTTTCVEIDITELGRSWMTDKLPNKGLILLGYEPNFLVAYDSCYSSYLSMIPFLRITYLPVTPSTCHIVDEGTSIDLTLQSRIFLG